MKELSQRDCVLLVMAFQKESEGARADERRRQQDEAYRKLNNLYLAIERGEVKLTVGRAEQMRQWVGFIYDRENEDGLRDYWQREFEQLPGWLNV